MPLWKCVILGLLLTTLGVAVAHAQPTTAPAADDGPAIALGVYWPWETTEHLGRGARRRAPLRAFLSERLDDLAAHHVNTIWTTNGPTDPAEVALLCELAAERNIRIVAGSGRWSMPRNNATPAFAGQAVRVIRRMWPDLDAGMRPLAFIVADEPQAAQLGALEPVVAQLDSAGIPTATVIQWNFIDQAVEQLPGLRILACDLYPFFGSPHGPSGDASYDFYMTHTRRLIAATRDTGMTPWIMPQAFQEIWGPFHIDDAGQLVAHTGAGRHWIMPTPAQVRWQAWSAVAQGAKGVVFFSYSLKTQAQPRAERVREPWAEQNEVNTGAPGSLVSWPDYRPAPQYEAMAETYATIDTIAPLLTRLTPITDENPPISIADEHPGDLVGLFRDDAGQTYALIVASPLREGDHIRLRLEPDAKWRTVNSSEQGDDVSDALLHLQPGEGRLLHLIPAP